MRSRSMWLLLGLVFLMLLAIGSVHPVTGTPAQRISNLENVLKCPSCADASLAQSETVSANEIKATITAWVHQGLSDHAIEARIVATYGQGELLRPAGFAIWIVPVVVVVAALTGLLLFFLRRRAVDPVISESDERRVLELLRNRAESRTGAVGHGE